MNREDLTMYNKETLNNNKLEPTWNAEGYKELPKEGRDIIDKGVSYYLGLLDKDPEKSLEGFTELCKKMTTDEMTMVIETLGGILGTDDKGHKFGK